MAARSIPRAFLRSARPAIPTARYALPHGVRAASRRGYASGPEQGKSSNALLWTGVAGLAVGGGAFYFLRDTTDPINSATFQPKPADYQKVYDAVAARLADQTDYDDGSYGPVCGRTPNPDKSTARQLVH